MPFPPPAAACAQRNEEKGQPEARAREPPPPAGRGYPIRVVTKQTGAPPRVSDLSLRAGRAGRVISPTYPSGPAAALRRPSPQTPSRPRRAPAQRHLRYVTRQHTRPVQPLHIPAPLKPTTPPLHAQGRLGTCRLGLACACAEALLHCACAGPVSRHAGPAPCSPCTCLLGCGRLAADGSGDSLAGHDALSSSHSPSHSCR